MLSYRPDLGKPVTLSFASNLVRSHSLFDELRSIAGSGLITAHSEEPLNHQNLHTLRFVWILLWLSKLRLFQRR